MRHLWILDKGVIMRVWISSMLLVLALVSPLSAVASELTITIAINSGPFLCDGAPHFYVWWNPEPVAIRLHWTRIWQGMTSGGRGDFWANIYIYERIGQSPPYALLNMAGWDHYAEPTAPAMSVWEYAPHWVTIPAGKGILMETGCVTTTSGVYGHSAAFVGYTK
jgi:hypothetical protein